MGQLDASMLAVLTREAVQRMDEFNAQSHAKIAWAFVTAVQLNAPRFADLAWGAVQRMDEFNTQRLAN